MAISVDTAIARLEIRDVLARYVQGVDRRDAALIRSCYHSDAFEAHHIFNGSAARFADWRAGQSFRSHHALSESAITFDGDRAIVETPHIAVIHVDVAMPELRGVIECRTSGWYLDIFSRRDGEWRIEHRHVSTFELTERFVDSAAVIDSSAHERLISAGFDLPRFAPDPIEIDDVAETIRSRFFQKRPGSA